MSLIQFVAVNEFLYEPNDLNDCDWYKILLGEIKYQFCEGHLVILLNLMKKNQCMKIVLWVFTIESVDDFICPFTYNFGVDTKNLYSCQ